MILFDNNIRMPGKANFPKKTKRRFLVLMFVQHSTRRLWRTSEPVRQYYENKTPKKQMSKYRTSLAAHPTACFANALHMWLRTTIITIIFITILAHSGEKTHHYLNLLFAHLQVVLVVDVHPLQGTAHPLICSDEEHDCKAACEIEKETESVLTASPEKKTLTSKHMKLNFAQHIIF